MPAYDFECRDCGNVVEQRHSMTNGPMTIPCDKCGGTCKRLIGVGLAGLVTPNWNAYTSIRLPKNLSIKGLKNDSSGRPQITGRQLEDRVLKETGFQRE